MKKNILLLLISLSFFIARATQAEGLSAENFCYENSYRIAETKFFAKILGGANFLENTKTISRYRPSYETGYIVSASFGYCWNYGIRLEGEYAYRRNAISKIRFVGEGSSRHGHLQVNSYMANVLWELPLSSWGCTFWNMQPFIGAGIGYDCQQMHSSNSRIVFHQKWNHFSWQLMTGLSYPIFCSADISLEYKFHQGACHVYDHSVGVGLLYKFGFVR